MKKINDPASDQDIAIPQQSNVGSKVQN